MGRNRVAASPGIGWRNETESGGAFKRNWVAASSGIRTQVLKHLIEGYFFIDNINEFLEPFEVNFLCSYFEDTFYFYKWDGKILSTARIVTIDRYCEVHGVELGSSENQNVDEISDGEYEMLESMIEHGSVYDSDYLPKDDQWEVIYEKK